MLQALSFQPAYAASLCSLVGKVLLRAYNDIGECLFVQARQLFANIVKLLCSFLCPLSLGAFALLLRSLVANVVEKFSAFRFPFSVFYYLCT